MYNIEISLLLKIERGGGLPRRGAGGVHTAAGMVSWGGGGGLNIFFVQGRDVHQIVELLENRRS